MKLFLIAQDVNTGYDTFDSAVVAAENGGDAQKILPGENEWMGNDVRFWCEPQHVAVKYLGEAADGIEKGVISASYNAG